MRDSRTGSPKFRYRTCGNGSATQRLSGGYVERPSSKGYAKAYQSLEDYFRRADVLIITAAELAR